MSEDLAHRAALSVWKFEPAYQALQNAEHALAHAQEAAATARAAWAEVLGRRPDLFPTEAHATAAGAVASNLKTMPGQADAHLRALLRYTEGFYATAIEHGMKAGPTANAIAHVERAGKALHEIVHAQAKMLASVSAPSCHAVPAHNFGKPLGWAVVADTPEHPKQHGMLCGGSHTFRWRAEQAASDPAHGKCVVIPLGPMNALEAAQALATTGAAD